MEPDGTRLADEDHVGDWGLSPLSPKGSDNMTSDNMKEAYKAISKLSLEELGELSAEINNTISGKKERFNELVVALEEILDEIFTDYPNAHIPLTLSPLEDIDIMDLIVPKDFVQKCKMGG